MSKFVFSRAVTQDIVTALFKVLLMFLPTCLPNQSILRLLGNLPDRFLLQALFPVHLPLSGR